MGRWDDKMTDEFQGRKMRSEAHRNNSACTRGEELRDACGVLTGLEVLDYNAEL